MKNINKVLLVKTKINYPIRNLDLGIPQGLWILKEILTDIVDVEIFDERLHEFNQTNIKVNDIIDNFDMVGVSSCTSEFSNAISILEYAKQLNKITFIGGIFTYSNEEYIKRYKFIDYIIPGIGTTPLYELIKKSNNGESTENIPGVFGRNIYRKNYCYPNSISSLGINNLEKIYNLYSIPLKGRFYTTTSRGCNNKCEFCSIQKETLGKVIYKNINTVKEEIFHLIKLGVKRISFKDEVFISSHTKSRSIELLEYANKISKDLNKKVTFKIKARIDYLIKNSNLIKALSILNVDEIQFGIESIDNEILKKLHKGFTLFDKELLFNLIYLCYDYRIKVNASFILSMYGEDNKYYDSFFDFIKYIYKQNELLKIYLNFYTPHPFNAKFNLVNKYNLINSNLDCFTHVIPTCYPHYFDEKMRVKLLNTYFDIINYTKSEIYNPIILDEHKNLYLTGKVLKNKIPYYKSIK